MFKSIMNFDKLHLRCIFVWEIEKNGYERVLASTKTQIYSLYCVMYRFIDLIFLKIKGISFQYEEEEEESNIIGKGNVKLLMGRIAVIVLNF